MIAGLLLEEPLTQEEENQSGPKSLKKKYRKVKWVEVLASKSADEERKRLQVTQDSFQ